MKNAKELLERSVFEAKDRAKRINNVQKERQKFKKTQNMFGFSILIVFLLASVVFLFKPSAEMHDFIFYTGLEYMAIILAVSIAIELFADSAKKILKDLEKWQRGTKRCIRRCSKY